MTATLAHMTVIPARDLRNHTSRVLEQVGGGASVTITVHGEPVAELRPLRPQRRRYLTRADVVGMLVRHQADAGLTSELALLAGETTDD